MDNSSIEKMAAAAWDDKYALGIPVIDEQHKKLVGLCEQFRIELRRQQESGSSGWQQALSSVLRETTQYTQFHFDAEEKILQAVGYKDLEHHKQCHREFVGKLTQMLTTFQGATLHSALEFLAYLKEWIITHIAYEDRNYVPYVMDYYRRSKAVGG